MKIEKFDTVASTNDYLKEISQKDPADCAVQAAHQTSGKGQHGNTWVDKAGEDLLISFRFKAITDPSKAMIISSIALFNVFKDYGLTPNIKLPNDILIHDKKIAGILIEHLKEASITIIGIGMNLNSKQMSDTYQSTSLFNLTNKTYDIDTIRDYLIEKVKTLIDENIKSLMEEYKSLVFMKRQYAILEGETVEILDIDETLQCKLDEDTWVSSGTLSFHKPKN